MELCSQGHTARRPSTSTHLVVDKRWAQIDRVIADISLFLRPNSELESVGSPSPFMWVSTVIQ